MPVAFSKTGDHSSPSETVNDSLIALLMGARSSTPAAALNPYRSRHSGGTFSIASLMPIGFGDFAESESRIILSRNAAAATGPGMTRVRSASSFPAMMEVADNPTFFQD